MTDTPAPGHEGPKLHCLGGQKPPPELLRGLEALLSLPPGARKHFWDALMPSLRSPLPADLDDQLDRFCSTHSTAEGPLGLALGQSRAANQIAAPTGPLAIESL